MAAHTIEVDEEVYEELKRDAEPFEDTPNSVLRRRLGLTQATPALVDHDGGGAPQPGGNSRRRRKETRRARGRAPAGALLPESEYELPILRVLDKNGGRAATQEVVTAVGEMVKDRLTDLDHELTGTGQTRWQSRVQFARLRMVERGWIASGSPRGVWEISDVGRAHLKAEG